MLGQSRFGGKHRISTVTAFHMSWPCHPARTPRFRLLDFMLHTRDRTHAVSAFESPLLVDSCSSTAALLPALQRASDYFRSATYIADRHNRNGVGSARNVSGRLLPRFGG